MSYFDYLLNSALLISIFTGFYWLFLGKETYYHWNRVVLIGSIFLAIFIPLVPVPDVLLEMKQVWIDQFQDDLPAFNKEMFTQSKVDGIGEGPLAAEKNAVDPAELKRAMPSSANEKQTINWKWWIYGTGLMLLIIRFLVQMGAILYQIYSARLSKGKLYHLASVSSDVAPYSFGKFIVLNPDKYDEKQFFQILNHEKIHVKLGHTFDLILAEVLIMIQWFNPFAWLHKSLITQNLEFQVDASVLSSGENKKDYQYHLLKIAVPNYPLSITTNYNQSLIKKRISMMNRKKSSLRVLLKYMVLVPITFVLFVAFKPIPEGTMKQISDDVESQKQFQNYDHLYVYISDQATPQELKALQTQLEKNGFAMRFNTLEYNASNKIVEAEAVFYEGETVRGISQFKSGAGEEKFIFFRREWTPDRFGTAFDEIVLNNLRKSDGNSTLLLKAGINSSDEVVQRLSVAMDTSPSGSKLTGATQDKTVNQTFTNNIEKFGNKDWEEVRTKVENATGLVKCWVDGIPWEIDEFLDLEALDIKSATVKYYRNVQVDKDGNPLTETPWNLNIKVNRRISESSPRNSQNFYLVISESTDEKELRDVQRDFAKNGIKIHFTDKNFSDGKLTEIALDVRKGNTFNGNLRHTFEDNPGSKVYFYLLGKIPSKGKQFGIGSTTDFDEIEKLPPIVRSALNGIDHGYLIGNWGKSKK